MSNIEKIRQEIERQIEALEYVKMLKSKYKHKDSLPEEKPSYVTDSPGDPGNPGEPGISDLEEAAEEYASKTLCDPDDGPTVGLAKGAFIAGAEWMYHQMTKSTERKGMPRQKTAYINGLGVETR